MIIKNLTTGKEFEVLDDKCWPVYFEAFMLNASEAKIGDILLINGKFFVVGNGTLYHDSKVRRIAGLVNNLEAIERLEI